MVNIKSITLISDLGQIFHFNSIDEFENWFRDSHRTEEKKNEIAALLADYQREEQAFEEEYGLRKGTLRGLAHILHTSSRMETCLADMDLRDIFQEEHETNLVMNLQLCQRISSTESAEHRVFTSTFTGKPELGRIILDPSIVAVYKMIKPQQ